MNTGGEDKTREHIQNTAEHTMSSCVEDTHFPFFNFFFLLISQNIVLLPFRSQLTFLYTIQFH